MRAAVLLIGAAIATAVLAASPAKELTAADLVERAKPAVVVIHATSRSGLSTGTGFIVDSNGVVVTNLHVIRGASAASIKCASGTVFDEVTVRAVDESRDLAILQVAGTGLPTVSLTDAGLLRLGSRAVVIGNPLGVLEWSVSAGIISAVREVDPTLTLIQTDVSVNPGNSGGPLLDEQGRVAGVVSMKIMKAEGLTFAIPAQYVRQLLTVKTEPVRLARYGERVSGKPANASPKQPTAKCRDGTFSYAKHHTGACSGHGGVAEWIGAGAE
jgi:S1-C subfamily serine protease